MLLLEFVFKFRCSPPRNPWHKKLLHLTYVTAACALVALGGLASVQDLLVSNEGARYRPVGVPKYRYNWFVVAWELVVLAMLAIILMRNTLASQRPMFMGLLAISTLLFIQFSAAGVAVAIWSLTTLQLADIMYLESEVYKTQLHKDRLRTTLAGGIMTATLNAILIVLVGVEGCDQVQKGLDGESAQVSIETSPSPPSILTPVFNMLYSVARLTQRPSGASTQPDSPVKATPSAGPGPSRFAQTSVEQPAAEAQPAEIEPAQAEPAEKEAQAEEAQAIAPGASQV